MFNKKYWIYNNIIKKILSLLTALSLTALSSVLSVSCENINNSNLISKEKFDLNLGDIKNFIEKTQAIKNLTNLEEVNEKLKQLALRIEGVTSLKANYYKITTNVIIKVAVEDNNYNLVGGSTFVVLNACKKFNIFIEDVKINAKKEILNLKNLDKVNEKLQIFLKRINNIYKINLIKFVNAKLKEIKQIGFYTVTHRLSDDEVIAVQMPTTVKKVPNELPKEITNLNYMFYENTSFNQDISGWDTSNIINMSHMFQQTRLFNQDISKWDTSKVVNMSSMFKIAISFNQDISKCDVSKVVCMHMMFKNAISFNQDISTWKVINVKYYYKFDINSNPN